MPPPLPPAISGGEHREGLLDLFVRVHAVDDKPHLHSATFSAWGKGARMRGAPASPPHLGTPLRFALPSGTHGMRS